MPRGADFGSGAGHSRSRRRARPPRAGCGVSPWIPTDGRADRASAPVATGSPAGDPVIVRFRSERRSMRRSARRSSAGIPAATRGSGGPKLRRYSTAPKTSAAFRPPNPNDVESTRRNCPSSGAQRTPGSSSATAGSTSTRLTVPGTQPSRIASAQIAGLDRARRAERMAVERLRPADRHGRRPLPERQARAPAPRRRRRSASTKRAR